MIHFNANDDGIASSCVSVCVHSGKYGLRRISFTRRWICGGREVCVLGGGGGEWGSIGTHNSMHISVHACTPTIDMHTLTGESRK